MKLLVQEDADLGTIAWHLRHEILSSRFRIGGIRVNKSNKEISLYGIQLKKNAGASITLTNSDWTEFVNLIKNILIRLGIRSNI